MRKKIGRRQSSPSAAVLKDLERVERRASAAVERRMLSGFRRVLRQQGVGEDEMKATLSDIRDELRRDFASFVPKPDVES